MPKTSAGILLFRMDGESPAVLLVHPGGPFWSKRDRGSWSIPKGEYGPGEDPETVARREFAEETGLEVPTGPVLPLGTVRQAGGKTVVAFGLEGTVDAETVRSNAFAMEWPPKSGRLRSFPEIDRAGWFTLLEAEERILAGQRPFLTRLEALLRSRP